MKDFSQEKYQMMPSEDKMKRKEQMRDYCQQNYAMMSEEGKMKRKEQMRDTLNKKYALMPSEDKDALILHCREEYMKLTPEEKKNKLKKQRETYAKFKCPFKREEFLKRVREAMQERRKNYTTEQMLRELERNSQRQSDIRRRGDSQTSVERRLLPPGRKCNIDDWNLTTVRYFNVGGLNAVCCYCKAEGFVRENKGKDLQLQNVHFGKMCCNSGKCILPLFPEIPRRLKEMYTSQTEDAKYFRNNIRLFNSGVAMDSVQVKEKQ